MLLLYSIAATVGGMALSLGVGSSTFALIFYFMGKHSAVFHETGRPYQKVVYRVLRIAMALMLAAEIAKVAIYMQTGTRIPELFAADALIFMWTVIAVLFVNPVLMTLHLLPTKFGAAIQATSWYTLGVLAAMPMVTFSYLPLLLIYAGGMLAFAVMIELITQKVAQKTQAPIDAVEIDVIQT